MVSIVRSSFLGLPCILMLDIYIYIHIYIYTYIYIYIYIYRCNRILGIQVVKPEKELQCRLQVSSWQSGEVPKACGPAKPGLTPSCTRRHTTCAARQHLNRNPKLLNPKPLNPQDLNRMAFSIVGVWGYLRLFSSLNPKPQAANPAYLTLSRSQP